VKSPKRCVAGSFTIWVLDQMTKRIKLVEAKSCHGFDGRKKISSWGKKAWSLCLNSLKNNENKDNLLHLHIALFDLSNLVFSLNCKHNLKLVICNKVLAFYDHVLNTQKLYELKIVVQYKCKYECNFFSIIFNWKALKGREYYCGIFFP
jgi:hypothetical protein